MAIVRKLFRKLWKIVHRNSYAKHAINNGVNYFVTHEMAPEFDWSCYQTQYSPYFLKYGLRIPMIEAVYYGKQSGIVADYYLSRVFSRYYLFPYLDKFKFIPAYHDKNLFCRLLKENGLIEIVRPVIYNSNGLFFDSNGDEISEGEAAKTIIEFSKDMIVKPAIGTCGGEGVRKIPARGDGFDIRKLFTDYRTDFVVQPCIQQHAGIAKFNSTSINTIRIVTYRKPDKTRKVLYAILRFGAEGAVCDNACSGGGYIAIDSDGYLKSDKACRYRSFERLQLADDCPKSIPNFDSVKKAVLMLHGQMPHFDIMAWDVALREDGFPVLVEYNIRFDFGAQAAFGPVMSKEDLDEIMPQVAMSVGRVEITDWIAVSKRGWDTCLKSSY